LPAGRIASPTWSSYPLGVIRMNIGTQQFAARNNEQDAAAIDQAPDSSRHKTVRMGCRARCHAPCSRFAGWAGGQSLKLRRPGIDRPSAYVLIKGSCSFGAGCQVSCVARHCGLSGAGQSLKIAREPLKLPAGARSSVGMTLVRPARGSAPRVRQGRARSRRRHRQRVAFGQRFELAGGVRKEPPRNSSHAPGAVRKQQNIVLGDTGITGGQVPAADRASAGQAADQPAPRYETPDQLSTFGQLTPRLPVRGGRSASADLQRGLRGQ